MSLITFSYIRELPNVSLTNGLQRTNINNSKNTIYIGPNNFLAPNTRFVIYTGNNSVNKRLFYGLLPTDLDGATLNTIDVIPSRRLTINSSYRVFVGDSKSFEGYEEDYDAYYLYDLKPMLFVRDIYGCKKGCEFYNINDEG